MLKAKRDILMSKFNQNTFLKNVLLISGSTIISQILILLVYPIVSRLYSVADFGMFQLVQSFLSFMVIAGSLRYDNAILLPKEDNDALSVWQLTLIVNISFFILFWLIIISGSLFNLEFGKITGIGSYLFYLPIIFLGAVIYQGLVFLNLRLKQFKTIGKTKIFQAVGNSSTQVGLGFLNTGPHGLFLGDLIGRSAGIYNLLSKSLAAWKGELTTFNFKKIKDVAKRYKDFAIYNTPGAILNTAGFTLPALFIGKVYGLEVLGLFAMVDRIYAAPSALVGQSVSQVFMSEAALLAKSDRKKLKENYLSLLKKLALIFIVPTLFILFFGPDFFALVFGEQWRESGRFASFLAVMQFAGFVVWPLIPTLLILELQRIQMFWEAGRVICILIGFYFCYTLKLPIIYAICIYGIVMFSFYIFHVLISLYWLNNSIKDDAKDVNH